jgi:CheY-like chemotaxis protein
MPSSGWRARARLARDAQMSKRASSPCLPPLHLLLVEDEPAVAAAHARLLRRHGFRLSACGSSLIALERITRGERFDVVVCDGQMPGLDCVAFFVRASGCWSELGKRIVFLSGGLRDEQRTFIQQRGLPIFEKPLDGIKCERLVAVIRSLAHLGSTDRGTGRANE